MSKQSTPASKAGCFSLFSRLITAYVPMALALLVQGLALAVCLCPAALALKNGLTPLPVYLAVSLVLLVFLALPLHISFGCAMQVFAKGGRFSVSRACYLGKYAGKMQLGLFAALRALVWFVPLAAAAIYGYIWVQGTENFTVIFVKLSELGKMLLPEGGLADGVFAVMIAALVLLGLGLFGLALASPLRYAFTGKGLARDRAENRSRLRGRWLCRLGVLLINLLCCLPCVLTLFFQLRALYFANTFFDFITCLTTFSTLLPILAYALCAYLPFVPVRRAVTAAFLFGKEGAPHA